MGALLRRYWHPVGATVELDDRPVRPVKILGSPWCYSGIDRGGWA
jgi:hypothetical protein